MKMPDETNEVKSVMGSKKKEPEQTVTLSLSELNAMVINAVAAAAAQSTNASTETAKIIAAAIAESMRPPVDPQAAAKRENDEMMREMDQELRIRIEEAKRNSQSGCEHIQGSNSLSDWTLPDGRSAFWLHQLDTSEWIGICSNCQKVVSEVSDDPSERQIFQSTRRKMGNRPSKAGQREHVDLLAAKLSRLHPPVRKRRKPVEAPVAEPVAS
jgi:hypothetical protein